MADLCSCEGYRDDPYCQQCSSLSIGGSNPPEPTWTAGFYMDRGWSMARWP